MAPQASSADSKALQVSIKQLRFLYWAVVCTSESGSYCESEISAACTLCNIVLTGAELRRLATAETESVVTDPILKPLLEERCVSHNCTSKTYWFHLRPQFEEHLLKIEDYLRHVSDKAEGQSISPKKYFRRAVATIVLCFLGAIALFLLRHLIYGYRIPIVQKVHKYTVEEVQ